MLGKNAGRLHVSRVAKSAWSSGTGHAGCVHVRAWAATQVCTTGEACKAKRRALR